MKTVIDELVTVLGIELDPKAKKGIDTVSKGLDNITSMAKWASAALIAAGSAISYFAKENAEAAANIHKLSELSNIASDTIQELGYAAIVAGGSSKSLEGDLLALTKSMSSPIPGEFNNALFMMGVEIKKSSGQLKTADEILMDVADKFKNMSSREQVQWASKLGISDDTIYMLRLGRTEIDRLRNQAKNLPIIVDEKSLKMAREFTIQAGLMKKMISGLGQSLAAAAGPVMTQMVKDFSEFIKLNKTWIQTKIVNFVEGIVKGFRQFGNIISEVRDYIYKAFPGMNGLIDKLTSTQFIADFVTVTLIALTAALAIGEAAWVALVGAIGGVAAVARKIPDLFDSMKEKTSNFADEFQRKYPNIVRFMGELRDILEAISRLSFNVLMESIKLIADNFKIIFDYVEKISSKMLDMGLGGIEKGLGASYSANDWMAKTFSFMPEWTKVPISDLISGKFQQSGNISVTQHITSPNPVAAGQESFNALRYTLQNVYSGDFSPPAQ